MPRGHKSKLRAREKRRQNKAEDPGVNNAQAPAGEEREAACSSSSVLGDGPSTSTGAGPLQAPPSAPATTSAAAGASGERSAVKAKGQVQKSKKASQASISTGAGPLQAPQDAPATTSDAAGASGERSAVKAKGQVQKSKKASQASISTGAGPLQAPPGAPATTSDAAGASGERSAVKAKGQVRKGKSSSGASTSTKSSGQDILNQKAIMIVEYLLYQYKKKEPIKKGEMLKIIHKWFRKDFPEILGRASERMDRFFGLQVKEVKPNGNFYTLVGNQDDTSDESVGCGFRFPNKGILMPLLAVIFLNGNRASEEEIWEFLDDLGIYDGKTHFIFGEPRKLITQDLVQEKYLVYQPMPNSDPPRYEFLWGPRAHAETSKLQVLEFLADLNDTLPTDYSPHYEEALQDEEERKQARAQAAPMAATPPKASGGSSVKPKAPKV
ncbi:hypothetical protein QTO34_000816 [Cnephaeus nilssonii]|uniref:MAGE domain-containing protein n=1 Tax=Cnephaeus nilssonii TaxID=3371016 RepID=A0AA40ICX7_CNENI|nr:hypothetical protein QTO34_000816 [Eptesicus nilssonii]